MTPAPVRTTTKFSPPAWTAPPANAPCSSVLRVRVRTPRPSRTRSAPARRHPSTRKHRCRQSVPACSSRAPPRRRNPARRSCTPPTTRCAAWRSTVTSSRFVRSQTATMWNASASLRTWHRRTAAPSSIRTRSPCGRRARRTPPPPATPARA